jgi:hypothetical protein
MLSLSSFHVKYIYKLAIKKRCGCGNVKCLNEINVFKVKNIITPDRTLINYVLEIFC